MDDFDTSLLVRGLFDPESLLQQHSWEPLCEGVYTATLYVSGDDSCRAALLHYLPGATVASHEHRGFEHIVILHGSQQDGEHIYQAGDLVIHKPGTAHSLHSTEGCIALGIWEKPVAFKR